jgi:hypothetical protein
MAIEDEQTEDLNKESSTRPSNKEGYYDKPGGALLDL